MSTPAISDREFAALLKASSLGTLLATFDSERRKADKPKKTTIAQRQAEIEEALAVLDDEKLIELQETLSNYVDQLAKAEVAFDDIGTHLTETQKIYLMNRHLDTKRIKELTEVVNKGLKRIIGNAVTAQVAAANPDEPHPENVSGSIEVPELNKRFCKEGAGYKEPVIKIESDLDGPGLRELLGDEWDSVQEVVHHPAIPAWSETKLSEVLLMAKAAQDPTVLQKIKAAFVSGGEKSWSYTVRDL